MEKREKILIPLLIIIIGFICYVSIFGLTFEGKESDFYALAVIGDNVSAYKNSCVELNLTKVAGDPEALIGQKVKVTGQLYNKEEYIDFDKTRTNIVLKVPELLSSPYILASYTGTLPFKKGDNITIYGEYIYPAADTTLQGMEDVGFPLIKARYIEKT